MQLMCYSHLLHREVASVRGGDLRRAAAAVRGLPGGGGYARRCSGVHLLELPLWGLEHHIAHLRTLSTVSARTGALDPV